MDIFYKNVDIEDLRSILEKGILSLDESGNNNWDSGKRADNATDLVYLFQPKTQNYSAARYGIVLLEVETDAVPMEMLSYDVNKDIYNEFVTSKVSVEEIKKIYIPRILKNRLLKEYDLNGINIEWCDMKAETWQGEEYAAEELDQFAETARLSTSWDNFFRGIREDRTVFDLYNVKYLVD